MNLQKPWTIGHRMSRIVMTSLVALMLLINTACSNAPSSPEASGSGLSGTERTGFQTELYDATQPNTGGMNQHNDDVRDSNPKLQAKTKALVDGAKRNVQKSDRLEDVPKVVGDKVEQLKDDVADRATRQKDDLVAGTKEGMRNLKGNLNKASKEIPKIVDDATSNAQNAVQRSADAAKDTAGALRENVERTTEMNRPLVR
jgi:hypothetical protein